MEVQGNQCLAFSVAVTANEPRNVKAAMYGYTSLMHLHQFV